MVKMDAIEGMIVKAYQTKAEAAVRRLYPETEDVAGAATAALTGTSHLMELGTRNDDGLIDSMVHFARFARPEAFAATTEED